MSISAFASAVCATLALGSDLAQDFHDPPSSLRAMPFWHINGVLTTREIKAQMQASRDQSGFGGVAVLPVAETRPEYLSEAYFARYGDILKLARELGMEVIFYDDTGFPSGSAGGRLAKLFPDDTMKRLDLTEEEAEGPGQYVKALPGGALMGVVAMNVASRQRIDITASVANGEVRWAVPAGTWRIMAFTCVKSGNRVVDYLCPESVDRFIGLTYEEYFKRFKEHFGTTIKRDFYDDVGFYAQQRPWTPAFNTKFQQRYGFSPVLYYPALWHDIGPETEAARVALFGFRAELMAEGYPKRVGDWCRAHGLLSSGHPPGNYDPCPVDMHCDTFKFYRHSDIPLMDAIFYHGHGRSGFKLVSSAAAMYDRPLVAAEEYGAYAEASFDTAMLYRTGMELFARGVTRVIPHGMWYDPSHVRIPPLISHFSEKLRPGLPDYNRWVARNSLLLQGGRSVVDIAMLYPIASLEAWYYFDAPANRKHWGQFVPPEADYQRLSDRLTGQVRRDFTFLHPDALESQCALHGAELRLNNASNWQSYKVVIVPGGKVIPWKSLVRIKELYDHGGRVVATTQLPTRSAEFGHDADVREAIRSMFNIQTADPTPQPYRVRIEVVGPVIKTFVNGALVDMTVDDSFPKGRVGFREAEHESASFANVTVTTPTGETLLQDDFTGGLGKWINVTNTAVREGRLTLAENQSLRSRDGGEWTDYVVSVDLSTSDTVAGVAFRARDDRNCYMWQFRPSENRMTPHKKLEGNWHVLKVVQLEEVVEGVAAFQTRTNDHGGKAYFASQPTAATLRAILDDAIGRSDVSFDETLRVTSGGGLLSYLHKVKDGLNIYYFANSSADKVDTWVSLRGNLSLEQWDPHTGTMSPAEVSAALPNERDMTRVHLVIHPVKSLFLVESSGTHPHS